MKNTKTPEREIFRNTLGIVNIEGKRKWIFPKKPKGRFYTARTIVSYFLLLFLIGMPFLKYNNEPIFLFNVIERKFIISGVTFGPHDFFILLLAMLAMVIAIVLFTVVYGRVFCGWICPQTVFMEMVFRKIEYWIEGDASKQRALKASPWNKAKTIKKTVKHVLFFLVSFFISNIFLAWIIGIDKLYEIITDPPAEHFAGLISIIAFSAAFYGVFAWLREQACILICPYGRLQGVLLDENSMVIAYDYKRGEPRGRLNKSEKNNITGDCVDCMQCVEVCPTGIDIRNGTQLECINCTACIDLCDYVMQKVNRPKGLIRFASELGIKEERKFKLSSARVIGYTLVLFALVSLLVYMAAVRSEVDVNIFRTPGLLSQQQSSGKISNMYDIKVTNKTFNNAALDLKLKGADGEIKVVNNQLLVKPQQILESKFFIILDTDDLKGVITPLYVEVYVGGKKINEIKTSFLGEAN